MKTLYFDCGMGAAGDMLTAALLELLPDKNAFVEKFNALGIPGVKMEVTPSEKCGILGTHVSITVHGEEEKSHDVHHHHHDHEHPHSHDHDHEHHHHDHEHTHSHDHHEHSHDHDHAHSHEHSHDHEHTHTHEHHEHTHEHSHSHSHNGLHEIRHIVSHLPVSEAVKDNVNKVYTLIAEAESHAHGVPVTDIHFHEVGSMDAIADVTAVCMLMEEIAPEKVLASPIHVGYGKVRCAHGILPVPAPATAFILKDTPIYGGRIEGELCTPTGAALLKAFVQNFGEMPVMSVSACGYGMGKKDFPAANCVRAMLGETGETGDEVAELCCNLDDMTGEDIGFAMEVLLENGALDVYTEAISMKKNRPAVKLCVLCKEPDAEKFASLMLRYTTTLGVRQAKMRRYTLSRSEKVVATPYGDVRVKVSSGYGVTKEKPEMDDIKAIAKAEGISPAEVKKHLK